MNSMENSELQLPRAPVLHPPVGVQREPPTGRKVEVLKKTITIGPFSLFFSNVNSAMGLKGHSHFACLKLTYQTTGKRGFPAFADTYAAIQEQLKDMTARPFRDMTNEDVADYLFERFANFDYAGHPVFAKWDGDYRLIKIRFAVRGVPDSIGHADGFTTYSVGYDF